MTAACLGGCVYFAKEYVPASREIRRLSAAVGSPILHLLGTTVSGISTIRSFGKVDGYMKRLLSGVDDRAGVMVQFMSVQKWFNLRLGFMSSCLSATIISYILLRTDISASLAGFVLSFTLQYLAAITTAVTWFSYMTLEMNAVERVLEYTNLPGEDDAGSDCPAAWPTEGRIEVSELVVHYAPELPAVLKGLSFKIDGSQRFGIVGRTGSGKSTLTLALLRTIYTSRGAIYIDGIDISKIKLTDLRSRITIVPQDPILFSGTIRSNLDPFDEYGDKDLIDALSRVGLESMEDDTVAIKADEEEALVPFPRLEFAVAAGGHNLSQGQRQLLCLARAIVARSKIIILDEATSSIDFASDALLQRMFREEFSNSTLIVIAHRLSTIADFDRILVMQDGLAAELGTPKELIDASGLFREMVSHSPDRDMLLERINDSA